MQQAISNAKNFMTDPKLYQYILVGGLSAFVDISLFLILHGMLAVHYLIIATGTFLVATIVNYILCVLFIFQQDYKHSSHKRLVLTYLVSAVGLLMHHSLLFLTYEWVGLPIVISKLFAMGSAFGWNFLSRKHFVFVSHE